MLNIKNNKAPEKEILKSSISLCKYRHVLWPFWKYFRTLRKGNHSKLPFYSCAFQIYLYIFLHLLLKLVSVMWICSLPLAIGLAPDINQLLCALVSLI